MKDNEKKEKKQANVIQFPKLKERLINKGLDALNSKKFKEALDLLLQAQDLTEQHDEIDLGIVICLLELGRLNEAKDRCKLMLHQDIGDYFNVLQIYLSILIQLGEYQEVIRTIEAVLEEDQIPPTYFENFSKLLELSRKMTESPEIEAPNYAEGNAVDLEETLKQTLIENDYHHEQAALLQQLKDQNIHKYVPVFAHFLQVPSKHPIIKTMVLQLLMMNKVSDSITMEKFGEIRLVVPSNLHDLSEDDYAREVLALLEDRLGQENPTLFEVAKELWLRYMYILFPFTPTEDQPSIWAAALHLYSCELQGIDIENDEIENNYKISIFQLKYAMDKIQMVEEVSLW